MADKKFPSLDDPGFSLVPRAWIQWKGTETCMDVYCKCGAQFHIDSSATYYVQCLSCKRIYEVSGLIKLFELDFVPDTCVHTSDDQENAILLEDWLKGLP